MAEVVQFYGTGRRKTSVARVFLRIGQGRITVNRRPFEDYFPRETLRLIVTQPLELTGTASQLDAKINVKGGGLSGQALIRVEISGNEARVADRWDMGQRIREVEQGADGSVYLLEDERNGSGGRLLRLRAP